MSDLYFRCRDGNVAHEIAGTKNLDDGTQVILSWCGVKTRVRRDFFMDDACVKAARLTICANCARTRRALEEFGPQVPG